jgi:hypothetical protein
VFLRTIRDLATKPGIVTLHFVEGNRVRYFGPVGLFFVLLTIFILVIEWLGIDFFQFQSANNPFQTSGSPRQEAMLKDYMRFIYNHLKFVSLIIVPITSFWFWVFFRRSKRNLLEHAVLVFYTSAFVQLFMVINLFVYYFTGLNAMYLISLLSFFYMAYASVQYYAPHYKPPSAFLRSLSANGMTYLTLMVIVSLLIFVYFIMNPEAAKNFVPPKR